MAKVTYRVLNDGDPAKTEWMGLKFEANVPREVANRDLIAAARANPWFDVEGDKPKPKPSAKPPKPMTSDEYRAWAVYWIGKTTNADELQDKWDSEEGLRAECEVGTDDLEYLHPFLVPRLERMRQEAAESNPGIR